jgi:hypothetical protein
MEEAHCLHPQPGLALTLSQDWSKVLFTDRKRFPFQYLDVAVRRCEWLEKREGRLAPAFTYPQGLHPNAGMFVHGISQLHLVEDTAQARTSTRKAGLPGTSHLLNMQMSPTVHYCPEARGCPLSMVSGIGPFNKPMIHPTAKL